jgi:hypothetical protein
LYAAVKAQVRKSLGDAAYNNSTAVTFSGSTTTAGLAPGMPVTGSGISIAGPLTCGLTNADATVTAASTTGLVVGMQVNAFTGVPAGATILSIITNTSFELSANATATNANQTFTFGGNDISIPPQNVVSYGKKFALSATSLHHNPFAFKTDGATAWASGAHNGTSWPVGTGSSHNIDTATSLGLAGWLHSSNYYKPYNGGRVVVWVDSTGTVKTSVNVMPPNARSIKTTAIGRHYIY